ncbi:hypothetical protein VFPYRLAN_034 [Candidatus Vidania fulgoroideae]|nr:hypothetical protein VFPYRLAN_034 [Candidatus Vidania fulgoroideae]
MIKVVNVSTKNLVKFKKKRIFEFLKLKKMFFENFLLKKNFFFLSLKDEDFNVLKKKFKKNILFCKKCFNISLIGKKMNNSFDYQKIFYFLLKNKIKMIDFFSTEYKAFFSIEKKRVFKFLKFLRKKYKI